MSEASTVWEVEDLRRLAQDVLQVGLLGGLIAFLGSYLNWRTGAVVATLAVGAGVLARYAVTVSADALNDAVTLVHVAVTETVADRFVGVLPRELAVPERRLEISLRRHLDTQAERLHDLLADGLVGPAQALADHAGALAGHSAAWGEVARELAASAAALSAAAQEQIDRIGREADRRAAELADRHAEAARQMAADMRRAHDEVLQAQSRQSAQALLDTSREVAETVAARAADVEARVADAVASLRESLPAATGSSVERAVAGAVDLTNLVRDQAGGLAQAISQISQNAARHLEAYDRWAERVDAWQAQLEQLLRDTGARHESLIVGWQQRADESMGRVERTLSDASNANARAIEGLKTWLATVVEQMVNLRGSLNELNAGIDDVRTAVDAVRGLVTEMEQSSVVLGRTTESAARALTVSAAAEVKHASALQEATEQLRRVSDAVGRLDGLRGGQEGGRQ